MTRAYDDLCVENRSLREELEERNEINARLVAELEITQEKLAIRGNILNYVAFVLAGDETADVQLAADHTKAELETLREEIAEYRGVLYTIAEASARLESGPGPGKTSHE